MWLVPVISAGWVIEFLRPSPSARFWDNNQMLQQSNFWHCWCNAIRTPFLTTLKPRWQSEHLVVIISAPEIFIKNKNFRVQKQPSCFHSCGKRKFSFFKSFPNLNRIVGRYIYQPQQQMPSSVILQWFTVLWKTLKLHFLNKWWLKTKDGRLSAERFIWGEFEEATRCSSAAYPPIGEQDHLAS